MIKELFNTLVRGEKQRETLSKLRSMIKEEASLAELKALAGDGAEIISLLSHEDAKTRKNAALLLGDLQLQSALNDLKDFVATIEKLTTENKDIKVEDK